MISHLAFNPGAKLVGLKSTTMAMFKTIERLIAFLSLQLEIIQTKKQLRIAEEGNKGVWFE